MKRLGVCALATVLAGCSGTPASSATHSTAIPATSAVASSSSQVSASPAAFPCRLPIVQWIQTPQGLVPSNSFLDVPGGRVNADPKGAFVQDGGIYRSAAQPYLIGGGPGAGTYDWPFHRWLPVDPRRVSPDGSHYAYESNGIHDVEVATGKDRPVKAPSSNPDSILYYAKEGIYFNHASVGPPGPGLGLLDPASGAVQIVFSDRAVDLVGGFAAWLPDLSPADAHPLFSHYAGTTFPNQVLRRDLNGGGTVPWFYQPGKFLTVVGFDQEKHALIDVSSGEATPGFNEIWQVPSAKQGRKIYSGVDMPGIVADGHGIWFSDKAGIWLYTASQGLKQVSQTVADLAGACQ